jgi:hypothetical protein
MLDDDTKRDLRLLQQGQMPASGAPSFERLSASAFISELRQAYSFVFQSRQIGAKQEIALAQRVVYRRDQSPPRLERCYLIDAYDDRISSVTWSNHVDIEPGGDGKSVLLKFGRGSKLDRSEEGWTIKPLQQRQTRLSEQLLQQRGWKFDLVPIAPHPINPASTA